MQGQRDACPNNVIEVDSSRALNRGTTHNQLVIVARRYSDRAREYTLVAARTGCVCVGFWCGKAHLCFGVVTRCGRNSCRVETRVAQADWGL